MHLTLKRETTRPAKGSLAAQQVRFNSFRTEYNEQRPHEALGQQTPASRYEPSPRVLPRPFGGGVPAHYEVRYVSANGGIRWKCGWVGVTHTLAGEFIGLNEVGDGLWTPTSDRSCWGDWTSASSESKTTEDG